jgi:site-specific recombinase XerD
VGIQIKDLFQEFLEYKSKNSTPRTIEEYRRFLYGPINDALGEKRLEDIKVNDREDLILEAKNYGATAFQRAVVNFRMLIKFAKDEGYNPPVDYRDFKVPKLPRKPIVYFTIEEIHKIRDSFYISSEEEDRLRYEGGEQMVQKCKKASFRMKAFCEVLLGSGLRLEEACSLTWQDIDWERKVLRVVNCKPPYNIDDVCITDKGLNALKELFEARSDVLPGCFSSDGVQMTKNAARKYLWKHAKKLGMNKQFSSRIFRKTFVTHLLNNGATLPETQALARHESPVTTLRHYAGVMLDKARLAHNKALNGI